MESELNNNDTLYKSQDNSDASIQIGFGDKKDKPNDAPKFGWDKLDNIIEDLSIYYKGELEKLKNKLENETSAQIVKIDKVKDELEGKIDDIKISIIETLGIFVALFTFISIDFQIFKSYRHYLAISGLSLIFLGSIIIFLIIFNHFILQIKEKDKIKKEDKINKNFFCFRNIILLLSILSISFGIFLFSKAPNEDLQDKQEIIKNDVYNVLRNEINNQNDEVLKEVNSNSITIEKINTNMEDIKKCVKNFGMNYKCFVN